MIVLIMIVLILCLSMYYSIATLPKIANEIANADGAINLPRTGQTTCYDNSGNVIACAGTGQDGDILAGVEWPSPRFTDNGDSTMTDNLTGLIWAKDASTPTVSGCIGETMNWADAIDYVTCLNNNNYLGYNDWVLPNVNQIESLIHNGASNSSVWLQTQGFTGVQQSTYWSSTTYANNRSIVDMVFGFGRRHTGYAWLVDMDYGDVFSGSKRFYNYAWPVRLGQSGSFVYSAIWKTGQTTSYHVYDDGGLQLGVAWLSPRFTDNSDGTITDNLTGLMWAQDASTPTVSGCIGGTMIWADAFTYVSCLNTANYLGYSDWRLPNRIELFSFADKSNDSPALPDGHPFNNVQSWYWSSTTYAGSTDRACFVLMDYGGVGYGNKSSSPCVWPVRLGQTGTFYNLTISLPGTGSGSVTSTPVGISCGSDCSESYASGNIVTLTAVANSNSTFTGWGGDCSGSSSTCNINVAATKNVTATFSLTPTYTLTLSKVGKGGEVVSSPSGINCGSTCSSTFNKDQTVTLSTTAASNSQLIGWDGCDSVSEANDCLVSMDENKTIKVRISKKTEKY